MDDIHHPVIKAGAAALSWVSLTWWVDWLTVAGQIAAALTALAIFSELVWKKVVKPLYRHLTRDKSADYWND